MNENLESISDYRTRYVAYQNYLESGDNLQLESLLNDLAETLNLIAAGALDEEQHLTLINVYFPGFLRILLRKAFPDYFRSFRKFASLLCITILTRLQFLQMKLEGDGQIFNLIFNPNNRAYDLTEFSHYESSFSFDINDDLKKNGIEIASTFLDITQPISGGFKQRVYNYLVNFFASNDGFQVLHSLIQTSEIGKDIKFFKKIIKAVSNTTKFLTPESYDKIIYPFAYDTIKIVKRIDVEQIKQIGLVDIKSINKSLKRLFQSSTKIEISRLSALEKNLGLKLISLGDLSTKQTEGFAMLKSYLGTLKAKYPTTEEYFEDGKKFVCKLSKQQFFQNILLMRTPCNAEVLKQSEEFLALLYIWDHINADWINTLWKQAISNQEQQVSLFQILSTLALHFEPKDSSHLFKLIQSQFKEIKDVSLTAMIKSLALNEFYQYSIDRSEPLTYGEQMKKLNIPYLKKVQDERPKLDVLNFLFEFHKEELLEKGLTKELQQQFISDFIEILQKYDQIGVIIMEIICG